MSKLTFNKCKLGSSNLYFYIDDQVCTKLFINEDHIKIIHFEGFKLPIKKLNSFLKDLGYIIYIEMGSGKETGFKLFRMVDSKTPISFHDIKKQFQSLTTCCLNLKGLKIPGCFQLSEVVNVVIDFIEYYNKNPSIEFINATQNFPILHKTKSSNEKVETETTNTQLVGSEVKSGDVANSIEVETKTIIQKETSVEHDTETSTETSTEPTNIYERKLFRAETESRIAQLKHNIAYLEFCLQTELNHLETI